MKIYKISEYIRENRPILFKFVLLIFLTLCMSGFILSKYSTLEVQPPIINQLKWDINKNEKTKTVTYSRQITDDLNNKSILFYAENAYINIKINNEIKYHFGAKTNVSKSPGSSWILYTIDSDIPQNSMIEIEVQYVYRIPNYTLNIYTGTTENIIFKKMESDIPDLIFNIAIFFVSFLFLIFYISSKKYKKDDTIDRTPLCYGIIGILLFLLSNCTLYTVQLIFSKGIGQYYLYYLTLFIAPLILLLYGEKYAKTDLDAEFSIHLFFISIAIVLQVFNICDFAEILNLYYLYTLVETINIIFKINKNNHEIKKVRFFIISAIIISLFCLTLFYMQNLSSTYKFKTILIIKIGFLCYITSELYRIIIKNISEIKNMYQDAYTDALTGVGNRNYLYKNIKMIKLEEVCVTFFDINNLKYYNDNFGHTYGDLLIKNATILMCSIYGKKNVYRIGGDEFVILQKGLTLEKQLKLQSAFIKKIKEYNSKNEINNTPYLEIACGNTIYQKGDKKYSDIIERADKIMYENKLYLKSKYDSQIYERN